MSIYIFLGTAGTGKGTQSKLLSEKHTFQHISTGDLLRDAVKNQTEIGKQVAETMRMGQLVSDQLINDLVFDYIKKQSLRQKFIFDGYPRTLEQAKRFFVNLNTLGSSVTKVIYFHLSLEDAIKRIVGRRLCEVTGKIFHVDFNPAPDNYPHSLIQRPDDTYENAVARYNVFMEQTKPLLDYYQDLLLQIDSNEAIESIYSTLESHLI